MKNIVVFGENKGKVKLLCEKTGLTCVTSMPDKSEGMLVLHMDKNGLSLIGKGLELRGDFIKMLPRIRHNNLSSELIIKAAKIKNIDDNPIAVDATAGLGEDSFLLAAAGFRVKLFEYNPIIAALLRDALDRALKEPELEETAQRMELIQGDSVEELPKLSYNPDIILLDPMFPTRQKNALVKKKLQVIQQLEHPCNDESELFMSALKATPKKIIIKRPSKGPYLADVKPSYSIERKSIRYDVVLL